MSRRTLIIGDLHGCYDEAQELLDRVAATDSDRVIFVGDLVDRGPRPRECVELAMRFECVKGNHEETHLRQRHRADEALPPDHLRTRQALAPEHYAYFESLPSFIRLPEYGAAVVHAGAFPELALEQQDPYHLLHAQCLIPPAMKSYWPSKAPLASSFWTHFWRGPDRLIFGHTVVDRPLVTEHAIGIDTGAVFGGSLTALVLPDFELVSVKAREHHRSRGGGIANYAIHGDVNAFS